MIPFFCITAAAKLTVERSVPIMVAMKSWVIGSKSGMHSILRHEQPPGEALLNIVQPIACAVCATCIA